LESFEKCKEKVKAVSSTKTQVAKMRGEPKTIGTADLKFFP